jgi:O-antigen/teichoic acid export membrane protein
MEEEINVRAVDQSLLKIARGGGLIFAGTTFGMAVQMMNRILIVRSISRADYGIFSLGLVLFSMAGTLSQGGFSLSVPRFLGYYRGKEDEERIRGVIRSAFEVELLLAGVLAVGIFLGAGYIENFYQMEGLETIVKIFALGIPVFNLIHIITNIFRGFDRVKPTLYLSNVLMVGLRFLFLLVVVMVQPSLLHILIAYIAALAVTGLFTVGYFHQNTPVALTGKAANMQKTLFLFSLPLFGTVFLAQFMKWTDVLMLGYFTSADTVGLYNGAVPLCVLVPIFLNSAGFIFVPVLSVLFSQGHLSEMKKTYSILTKWTFSCTLPLFLVIFIFSRVILTFLFGPEYEGASTALRILSAGYMFHVSMGPIGQNLVIFGRPKLIMINNSAGFLINIVLNLVLIPVYGIDGAAAATAVTYVALNILAFVQVYRISGIHPFSRNYVKLLGSSVVLAALFFVLFRYSTVPYWVLPLIVILFAGSYFLVILVIKCFDREDIMLLKTVEKKAGVDLMRLRKILNRFL